jgi:hypothetical protein
MKIGTRIVKHARYAGFQKAKVSSPRAAFQSILSLINGLRGPPAITVAA